MPWLSLLLIVIPVAAADFHVAPGPGAAARLRDARDEARKVPAGEPRRIVLSSGDYFIDQTLELDARDNGLVIDAAPGAKPKLYGGFAVEGWRQDGPYWSAASGGKEFRLLSVNGRLATMARFPHTGYLQHLSDFNVRWMSTTGGGWERKPTPEELTTMRYRAGDLPATLVAANAEVRVYHMWDESLVRVAAIDRDSATIRFASPAGHPPGGFNVHNYVVFNVREGMHAPGDWYLDRAAGKVVYWPRPGEDMRTAVALAPSVEAIVRVRGSRDKPAREIALRGLTLAITNTPTVAGGFGAALFEGAISFYQAEECVVDHVEVSQVAGQGIKAQNVKALRILHSFVRDTGAAGILVRGERNEVADNRVAGVGRQHPSAIGITVSGLKSRVSHNEVSGTPYTAMSGGGDGNVFEANHIHHAMLELHDGAAIYVGFGKGNVLTGNYAHDIPDTGGYGSSAYYLDEQCDGCVVEGNVSAGVGRPSHNHMAHDGLIRGNLFLVDGDARITLPKSTGFVVERNVLVASGSVTLEFSGEAVSALRGNIIFSGTGKVERLRANAPPAERKQKFAADAAAVQFADPGVVKAGEGVWRFQPGSPAAQLGLGPFDVRGCGPRP